MICFDAKIICCSSELSLIELSVELALLPSTLELLRVILEFFGTIEIGYSETLETLFR